MIPSITQDAVFQAVGDLLDTILPSGVTNIIGQVNRVASPEGDYVVMWSLMRPRLSTNIDTSIDSKFTASIAATVMTVSAIALGVVTPGNQIFGTGVANNTVIENQLTGPAGGAGTYTVSISQTVTSRTMSAGELQIEQSTEVVLQLDVHGPNSGDNAQVISTIFRSAYGIDQMEASGITPLFADDPRQAPFETAAKQFEDRWTVDIHLQIKPSVSAPQEFSDSNTLTIVNVDVAYPPS